MELAHHLDLTMVQVHEHQGDLYELDTKLLIFNKTLISTMKALSHIWYILSVLTDVHTAVTQLMSGILSLKEGVDLVYECMCALRESPNCPPSDLRKILLDVKDKIYSRP